jgi:hypothetical protein
MTGSCGAVVIGLIKEGKLKIVAAYYNLGSGRVALLT